MILVGTGEAGSSLRHLRTQDELEAALGRPAAFLRRPCGCASPERGLCLRCQLDPFETARRAGIGLDVGDKYDGHSYMFMTGRSYSPFPDHVVRAKLRLEPYERYPNDDRSDALNPNNPAHQASVDNRADHLNPNNERFVG